MLEGHVSLEEYADEGPYGDHTGYYNSVEQFPVFTVSAITMRREPIYLSTFTGRPPDEPSVLGEALNEVFIPLLQQQYPEITDFWLPPEGCSYRIAVISMKKAYPGHAKRVMMGAWSFLRSSCTPNGSLSWMRMSTLATGKMSGGQSVPRWTRRGISR